MSNHKDELFRAMSADPGSFRFDQKVVDVFPDMINRSVPGYGLMVPMTGQLARRYAAEGTNIYDLGCSLGACTLAMRSMVTSEPAKIVAVDNSRAMIEGLGRILDRDPEGIPVEMLCIDVMDLDFQPASFAVLNFTLQFLKPEQRETLLTRVCENLVPGGALVLSEKIFFNEPPTQQRQTDWHHDFKRLQGYSDLEIARKRTALERVLVPETEAHHVERLEKAGFSRVTRWFQCFGFCSYLAEK